MSDSDWDKTSQRNHCLHVFGLLIVLLGEFPKEALEKASNMYLLKACVALQGILLNLHESCGVVTLTRKKRTELDGFILDILNAALFKSVERKYLAVANRRLDLYAWLLCWQCGYWAFNDARKKCPDIVKKKMIDWGVLKSNLDSIDQYIEGYEEQYPTLQDDGWELYEQFLKIETAP